MLGLVMLILPALFFLARTAFAVPIAVSGPNEFAGRPVEASLFLTRRIWPGLALLFTLFFLISIAQLGLTHLLGVGPWIDWVFVPILTLGEILLYGCLALACDRAIGDYQKRHSAVAS
jgi:hypothetical protein